MSKANRIKAAQQAELQAMALAASNLQGLTHQKYLLAGIEVGPVTLQTPVGPTPGASIICHMHDGSVREPIVIDVYGLLNLMHGATGALIGAVPTPNPSPDLEDTTPTPESTTTSGLIIPGA